VINPTRFKVCTYRSNLVQYGGTIDLQWWLCTSAGGCPAQSARPSLFFRLSLLLLALLLLALLLPFQEPKPSHVAVKEVVLPFNKFPGADTLLGPEMRSTGKWPGPSAILHHPPPERHSLCCTADPGGC
jgi:hypothetical protein